MGSLFRKPPVGRSFAEHIHYQVHRQEKVGTNRIYTPTPSKLPITSGLVDYIVSTFAAFLVWNASGLFFVFILGDDRNTIHIFILIIAK